MRILIVDDNASVRCLARIYAEEEAACEVVEAGDGPEALRLAREEAFDLAIVDYHMPEMNGLELTCELLALEDGVEVVAWTSVLDPAVERAFLDRGATCHVAKTNTAGLRRVIRERARATMPPRTFRAA